MTMTKVQQEHCPERDGCSWSQSLNCLPLCHRVLYSGRALHISLGEVMQLRVIDVIAFSECRKSQLLVSCFGGYVGLVYISDSKQVDMTDVRKFPWGKYSLLHRSYPPLLDALAKFIFKCPHSIILFQYAQILQGCNIPGASACCS